MAVLDYKARAWASVVLIGLIGAAAFYFTWVYFGRVGLLVLGAVILLIEGVVLAVSGKRRR
jgi:hypothetical protein